MPEPTGFRAVGIHRCKTCQSRKRTVERQIMGLWPVSRSLKGDDSRINRTPKDSSDSTATITPDLPQFIQDIFGQDPYHILHVFLGEVVFGFEPKGSWAF